MLTMLLFVACNGGGKDSTDDSGGGGGDAANGATLYAGTCAGCHGDDGKQGTEISGTPATDLTVAVPATSDANMKIIMKDGTGAMPPQLSSDSDLADCLAYLRETFP